MNQPLAYVHPGAKIAKNVVVEPFSTINNNVEIGEGTWVGSNVTIMEGARIGKNCFIYPGAVISANPQDLKFEGEDSLCEIGDNTTIRECVTINRGTKAGGESITKVGDDNWIMAYVHIAHDCVIGNSNVMSNATSLAGHVIMGSNIVLAGYVLVHQFCKIGDYSFAGMGAALNQDLPPYLLATGSFAKTHGLNREGLRRNNFDQKKINALHKAYKLIFRSSNNPTNIKELENKNIVYKKGVFPFTANSRAKAIGHTEGFVKILSLIHI